MRGKTLSIIFHATVAVRRMREHASGTVCFIMPNYQLLIVILLTRMTARTDGGSTVTGHDVDPYDADDRWWQCERCGVSVVWAVAAYCLALFGLR